MKATQGVAAFLTSVLMCPAQPLPELRLRAVEGKGMVVARGVQSSRRIAVEVTDGGGRLLAGATVVFRLPDTGATGRFASGLLTETLVTGADGRASVYGITWGEEPGALIVRVSAAHQARRTSIEIPVEISATAQPGRLDRNPSAIAYGGGSGTRKWLIIAGVAGGALAGLAAAGMGKSASPPTSITQPVRTPTVGAPSISINRP